MQLAISSKFSDLVELLHHRALHQSEKTGFIFLRNGDMESGRLTYRELDSAARAIAAQIQAIANVGERALLLFPPGLEFVTAFFGCLYAGLITVPTHIFRANQNLSKILAIAADSQASVVLTTTALLTNLKKQLAQNPTLAALRWLATDDIASHDGELWQQPSLSSDDLALFQYTSGSTGTPRGVMVSHGNLLHNSAQIKKSFEHTHDTRAVMWLPLYHDMGLIGGVLQPLYSGFTVTLMSPIDLLQKPYQWLQAITRYKAGTSGGPNFAYDLCIRKITPEQRESLDLSSWDVAFTGAEPVRAGTLEQFVVAFESCGFRREAFYPCYGLAEATLLVSGGVKAHPPVIRHVEATSLAHHQVPAALAELEGSRPIVGCGHAWLGQKILIVDPKTLIQCPDGQIGEIWVSGLSVAKGYWNRPEETEKTFNAHLADGSEAPALRTGDLGFMQDGELFVTGRLKDLIIIRGRNHYPQDIELTVEQSHEVLVSGCGAAFTVEVKGVERLVVVHEVGRKYLRNIDVDDVVGNIRRAVAQQHELDTYALVLIRTASMPKTSSGKVQRHLCRAKFLDGTLDVVGIG